MKHRQSISRGRTSYATREAEAWRLLDETIEKRGRPLPAHSRSHFVNGVSIVDGYLNSVGIKDPLVHHLARVAYILHDMDKGGVEPHNITASRKVKELLGHLYGKRNLARITGAIANHAIPAVGNGRRLESDPVSDAVFFADRVEASGAYGTMRIMVGILDERHRPHELESRVSVLRHSGEKQADLLAREEFFTNDADMQIRLCGHYLNRGDDRILVSDYYPPQVQPVMNAFVEETRGFVNSLARGRRWANEVAEFFLHHAGSFNEQLNDLVESFHPRQPKAREFKKKALVYANGELM